MQVGSPVRSPFALEPLPPLKAALDLPLRVTLSAERAEGLRALGRAIGVAKTGEEWLTVYRTATELVEAVVRDLDARLEQAQRDALQMDDPNELRQRVSGAPRREADKARGEAKAALQRQTKEWTERTRRQLEHVLANCQQAAQSFKMTEEPRHEGVTLGIDAGWWAQYVGFVDRCCDQWSGSTTEGAEEAFGAGVRAALGSASKHSGGRMVQAPDLQSLRGSEAKLVTGPPTKDVDIPSVGGALMHSVRSNIMAVGIFGTVLTVLVTLGGKLFGMSGDSGSSMLVRGGMILVVLPFSIVFGLRGARRERVNLREKGNGAYKQTVAPFIKGELEKGLERHRKALERWLNSRAEAWTGAIDRWWDAHVEQKLLEYDAGAVNSLRDLKLQQVRVNEEIASLRASRTQLGQNLLFDLRRRVRELEELPSAQ